MKTNFWMGKRVLVTGHTGFKGSWLSIWLHEMGAHVGGVSLDPPSNPSLYEAARVDEIVEDHRADICNYGHLAEIFDQFEPEIVIHLAAQSLVRYSYENPRETYLTNVVGSLNVLEACRLVSAPKSVVMVTTDKCYENKEWYWGYRETERMGGHDPYSSSKGCAELLIASYRRSYFSESGVKVASARAGNVIGGGDWAVDRLVPDVIKALDGNQLVTVRNPQAIRPWQHVLEPLSGYLCLAEKLYESHDETFCDAWNFGPEESDVMDVESIVRKFHELFGREPEWKVESEEQHHEAKYLKLECSKAKAELGWKPHWNIHRCLDSIAEWHKDYSKGISARELVLRDIMEFRGNEDRNG